MLTLAMACLMFWSIFEGAAWLGHVGRHAAFFRIDRGRVALDWLHNPNALVADEGWQLGPGWGFGGVEWLPSFGNYPSVVSGSLPLWIPLLLAAAPTVMYIRAGRRRRSGLCPACGYDLSGAPSATCPECGTALRPTP